MIDKKIIYLFIMQVLMKKEMVNGWMVLVFDLLIIKVKTYN